MKKIVIASMNNGKIKEYKAMLEPLGFEILSLHDFPDLPDVEETGKTFLENALLKVQAVQDRIIMPVIADDSGLVVDCLNGRPGVNSRRYSESEKDEDNNMKLMKAMSACQDRSARFVCQIVYKRPDQAAKAYSGTLEGKIATTPVIGNGFGYDPIFYVCELNKMMSELTTEEKNRISHRGKAMAKLMEDLSHDG
ncbi:MAG: XTP/dITP diphosphatase [Bacilli bacterium]|nr:XTP/dITP diphosphatase [Bacilli bacterium]